MWSLVHNKYQEGIVFQAGLPSEFVKLAVLNGF